MARQKPSPPEYIQILTSIICASLALEKNITDIEPPYCEITDLLDDIMDADGFIHKDLPTHITVLKSVLVLQATLHKIKTDFEEALNNEQLVLQATLYGIKTNTPEILEAYINKLEAYIDKLDSYIDKMWQVVRFFYNINKDFAHMAGENRPKPSILYFKTTMFQQTQKSTLIRKQSIFCYPHRYVYSIYGCHAPHRTPHR